MCGICGFAGFRDDALLERMTNLMIYRGPDDVGFYRGPAVGLGCRRLSIIDLVGGHQPMADPSRGIVVVQNGEIYNYKELREELKGRGVRFRTESDTEVLLYAYQEYGEDFCKELNGDFAIAIWDERREALLLARDRFGVHPLYYCHVGNELVFASELKCLLSWPKAPRRLDPVAIDQYLTLRYVPRGKTLFADIQKLPPGCLLTFTAGRVAIRPYWRLEDEERTSREGILPEADRLWDLLNDSVRLRMRSDVPVGAYLSGGLDSSLIVALMSSMTSQPVETFSIGFGTQRDELEAARAISRRFGTRHHELFVGKKDFELLPKIVWHLDEPIGDAIVIPIDRLSQEAARFVKVVLSGEGADEVWGGYIHHLAIRCGTTLRQRLPAGWIKAMGAGVKFLPTALTNRIFPYPAALGERGKQALGDYLKALSAGDLQREYFLLASVYRPEEKSSLYTPEFLESLKAQGAWELWGNGVACSNGSRLKKVMEVDLQNWLPDYTLLKQDKLGLAHSLEVRVPYLDHRVVEFAHSLPADFKIKFLTTKRLLREVAARALPESVARTPKRAFLFPVEKVFGAAFDEYVRDLLTTARCRDRGIISSDYLKKRLSTVRTGELVENKQVIALLILEIWFRTFLDQQGLESVAA